MRQISMHGGRAERDNKNDLKCISNARYRKTCIHVDSSRTLVERVHESEHHFD